ncbi:diheme cytochrome peroxidase [Psychroflexus torquis ATCC 700755]|uniref:Methylamine utilization protein MauG n=1 Tax=Psychroflexus torquis (strain ATCC 700755 / CIP 106069 / ACAM 623) TaxID=313595 RepID=K4IHU4_PSYTT|nr:cytochrome-c peroxidase [Psychroflexus torquis]AFU70102.1 diheme cytochrome peroxidase [Psychroflexus torquis ATCC 700755]
MTLKIKHIYSFLILAGLIFIVLAFKANDKNESASYNDYDELRKLYGSGDQTLWPEPVLDPSIDENKFQDLGTLLEVEFPESNPYSKEKAELGEQLFFEKRLSQSGQIACASCHDPSHAWADPNRKSKGHNGLEGNRNSMSILNTAYVKKLFWDGRVETLEEQVKFPIEDPREMNLSLDLAVENIKNASGYIEKFENAFGTKHITAELISKAIATFERTKTSGFSKFDKFINGETNLFTDEEVLGLHIYRTKANCISCHNTPLFSDNQFHNDGQSLFGSSHQDLGLFEKTKDSLDMGKFRTPSLREVNETGPWMHNGNFLTLTEIIDYYNLGNPSPIQKKVLKEHKGTLPKTSTVLRNLRLSDEEKSALIAFIKTLSSNF